MVEVTRQSGLPPPTAAWPPGTYDLPEITPGGVALLDYDNDGRLDIYQVCHAPPGNLRAAAPNKLFQQQPDGTFRDVSRAAGVDHPGYGQGVAVGDVNNDGHLDLFVTNLGPDVLYLNRGDGTFIDATQH